MLIAILLPVHFPFWDKLRPKGGIQTQDLFAMRLCQQLSSGILSVYLNFLYKHTQTEMLWNSASLFFPCTHSKMLIYMACHINTGTMDTITHKIHSGIQVEIYPIINKPIYNRNKVSLLEPGLP